MAGPGGLIRSGKLFRVTLVGELPAEVPANMAGPWLFANLSFTAQLAARVQNIEAGLIGDGTDPAPGGSRLHQ